MKLPILSDCNFSNGHFWFSHICTDFWGVSGELCFALWHRSLRIWYSITLQRLLSFLLFSSTQIIYRMKTCKSSYYVLSMWCMASCGDVHIRQKIPSANYLSVVFSAIWNYRFLPHYLFSFIISFFSKNYFHFRFHFLFSCKSWKKHFKQKKMLKEKFEHLKNPIFFPNFIYMICQNEG